MLEVVPDFPVLGQIEEILFEKRCQIAQVLVDLLGTGALLIHRPLEGYDDRNSEIAEQPGKVPRIRLDPGAKPIVRLRQEKFLDVDDDSTAAIGDDLSSHRMSGTRGQCRSSVVQAARTSAAISEYAATVGASTL
jgi:hypothetical protein